MLCAGVYPDSTIDIGTPLRLCARIYHELWKHIKDDDEYSKKQKTFGQYVNDTETIHLQIKNRHILDVFRTLAHEMVHHKQDVAGELNDRSGEDGSPEENEANAKAAVIMRLWAKMNPELFQRASILAEQWSKDESNRIYNWRLEQSQ